MRLDLIVGPNGAGKTTFVRKILLPSLPPGTPFVNADEIAARRWPDDPEGKSYEAAQVAAQTRQALIQAGKPLVAETVFSHPSKLDLIEDAHRAGYTVALHVVLVPEELAVRRVQYRVVAGGHPVPEDKIRQRYLRLWALVAQAMEISDTANVYDNSRNDGPRDVVQIVQGVAVGAVHWPEWTPSELATHPWGTADK